MSGLVTAALRYLPRTVPLRPAGKLPAVDAWPSWPATRATVERWWRQHPESNLGVRTGRGLAVLDVDPRRGGDTELARLQREHGALPATCEVVTGGNGRHLYFRARAELRSSVLADGLELKAAGAQVVAPPSVHPDTGRIYVWHPARPLIEREIAPLPAWLMPQSKPPAANVEGLAERDGLHRIPAVVYVPRLTGRPIQRGYARCPFHAGGRERTPSLRVYDAGGWKCYACQAAGRIYQLAGLLGGFELPLSADARRLVRGELIREFAWELSRV